MEDITLRKQVEANLNQQVYELQELNLLKDEFLSTVSHELRAPMANIKMSLHLLEVARSTDELQQYLEILNQECDREIDLINDLLDLQRLEAGLKLLEAEAVDLDFWLPAIVEAFYPRAESRQITLHLTLDAELPRLHTDPMSLRRLVTELINNACKYTPPEHDIVVAARCTPPHITIEVSNSGVEIAHTELTKIFDKFYRIPSSDRWGQGGTGLGLALVKKLTEHMGGRIHVRSQANVTTFAVVLPVSASSTLS